MSLTIFVEHPALTDAECHRLSLMLHYHAVSVAKSEVNLVYMWNNPERLINPRSDFNVVFNEAVNNFLTNANILPTIAKQLKYKISLGE